LPNGAKNLLEILADEFLSRRTPFEPGNSATNARVAADQGVALLRAILPGVHSSTAETVSYRTAAEQALQHAAKSPHA
jgi:hypothetical protein